MALYDIVATGDNLNILSMARGNGGTVVEIVAVPGESNVYDTIIFLEPVVGDVKSGVGYGQEGTEHIGTYVPAGGSTYSRGRVVNDA